MSTPLYNVGDVVYLKESAAIGFLEPVRISGIHYATEWMYTINMSNRTNSSVAYTDSRRSYVNGTTLFFTESEFITLCDALTLAEANAQASLNRIQAQRSALCT